MRNQYYDGPRTDHFDGTRFFLPRLPASDRSLWEVLRWKMFGKRVPWPKMVPARTGVCPQERVAGLKVTHIGHASYLLQTDNRNFLIDPIWAERASPLRWAGPRRHNAPAILMEALPPIDAVLITHNHYDHLDLSTMSQLWKTHRPRIFTPLGNDTILRVGDPEMRVETGDWWDSFQISETLRVIIVPAYHWSSRSLGDRRMALWGGFVLEAESGVVYCAGDTAYRDGGALFKEIGRRFGPPRLAMLPIGAYAPRWFMQTQHANPAEAVQIARDCGAKQVLGVHWGTFALTDEPYEEPVHALAAALRADPVDGVSVQAVRPGDTWECGIDGASFNEFVSG